MLKNISKMVQFITLAFIAITASTSIVAKENSITFNSQMAKNYFESKLAFTIGPVEVSHLLEKDKNMQIIDVRYAADYAKGHVPGAINLPPDSWSHAQTVLSKKKVNVLYCYSQVCHLAAQAAIQFASMGYPVKEMEGGYTAWVDNSLPVQRG